MAHSNRVKFTDLTDSIAREVREELDAARGNPDYVRKAKNTSLSNSRPRTTIILGELIRGFILDSMTSISNNDVIDLLHAAMTVNCCDYALLDGPWVERVNKMKQRLAKAGIEMPLAKCFSIRNSGVSSFLVDIEAFIQRR